MKKIFKLLITILTSPFILKDYVRFTKYHNTRFTNRLIDIYPKITDKTITTNFDRHYIYHTAWAARKVKEINPTKHVDISSSLYFSSIVSAFIPIDFYDYRPAALQLSNLRSCKGDLHHLPFAANSVASISCMHTIEHVGLGRYGDPIDPDGDIKAIKELQRVAARDGHIIFVVPVGQPKIAFNAHRIYSYEQIISYFSDCTLREFTLIPEHQKDGDIILNADPALVSQQTYGCGCFWFIKK